MTFNSDLSKQSQEVILFRKTVRISHRSLTFKTVPVARTACQKHLGLYLDEKVSFFNHINAKISKANKRIGIIKKIFKYPSKKLPFNYLQVRPHFD